MRSIKSITRKWREDERAAEARRNTQPPAQQPYPQAPSCAADDPEMQELIAVARKLAIDMGYESELPPEWRSES